MNQIIPRSPSINPFGVVSSSEADLSSSETLPLPWYGMDQPNSRELGTPSIIETSRWTKSMLLKACKVFGVNVAGFEHEIFDMILRMEHKRRANPEAKIINQDHIKRKEKAVSRVGKTTMGHKLRR